MEFFIVEDRMSPTCRTNIRLAYNFGKLEYLNDPGIEGLYLLFLARDGIIKGYPDTEVDELLMKCSSHIERHKIELDRIQ